MAETTKNKHPNRTRGGSRLGPIGDSIRERPLATAAVATAAAAAGAFFFARRSGVTTDTVAKWGQDAKESLGNLTGQASADDDSAKQGARASSSPSTKTSTPSGDAAGKLSDKGGTAAARSDSGAAIPTTSQTKSSSGGSAPGSSTGLDETGTDQAKVGSVAYGA